MVTEKQNAKHPWLDINAIRDKIGEEYAQFLPVLHAISGCDTTSMLYGIGKIKVLKKHKEIIAEAKPFLLNDSTPEQIEEAGRKILCLIYDGKDKTFCLNKIRKKKFEKNVIKGIKHRYQNPPTNQ